MKPKTKLTIRVLLIIILGGAVLFYYFNNISGGAVTIADSDLREAVKQAAHKPFGAITTSDLEKITALEIGGDANPVTVTDLSALAYCDNLTSLTIENNTEVITDFSPLAGLPDFKELNLINGHLTDVSTLSSLTGLVALDLTGNRITDISPLLSLKNLRTCYLYGNPLS